MVQILHPKYSDVNQSVASQVKGQYNMMVYYGGKGEEQP